MAGIKAMLFVIGFALFPFVMAQEVVNNAYGGNEQARTNLRRQTVQCPF